MGSFQYSVMSFGLKNAPAMFSRVVISAFKEFIHKFLEVYFDDWTIFGLLKDHIASLRLMLDKCRQHQISLNLKKCIFCAPFGILLGHIVCKQWLMVDPAKIAIIVKLPPPKSVKQLCTMFHQQDSTTRKSAECPGTGHWWVLGACWGTYSILGNSAVS